MMVPCVLSLRVVTLAEAGIGKFVCHGDVVAGWTVDLTKDGVTVVDTTILTPLELARACCFVLFSGLLRDILSKFHDTVSEFISLDCGKGGAVGHGDVIPTPPSTFLRTTVEWAVLP
jgi:hypothetical protein